METEAHDTEKADERWELIRDLLVFQCKLVADGVRDLLLLPLSLAAGIISLLGGSERRPGTEFYDLLRMGRRTERWINLFGALERKGEPEADEEKFAARDLDEIAARVETFLVEEYRKGGMTAQAKQRMDDALDLLRGERKPRGGNERTARTPG